VVRGLIRSLSIAALVLAGIVAMHRGVTERARAEPQGQVALTVHSSTGVGTAGAIGSPGQVELRSPERVQVLGPALSRTGQGQFHLGVGLLSASLALAMLGVVRGNPGRLSKAVRLGCLVPAAWSLVRMILDGGPQSQTGAAAIENLTTLSPVFVLSILLSLSFGSGRTATPARTQP
jgi:hypothetical protein